MTTTTTADIVNENNKRTIEQDSGSNDKSLKSEKSQDVKTDTATSTTTKKPQSIYKGRFKGFKKHSRLFATSEKVKGLLVTCDQSREANSIGEILPLVNLYADKYFPKEVNQKVNNDEEESGDEAESDTEDNSKTTTTTTPKVEEPNKRFKRFELINSGCGGIYFVNMPIPDICPIDFMNCILIDIYKRQLLKHKQSTQVVDDILAKFPESSKKMYEQGDQSVFIPDKVLNKIRFTAKMVPITRTCRASDVDFYPIMKDVIKEKFENIKPNSFGIEMRTRNNHTLNKNDTIKDVAAMVDPEVKVDLSNPEYVFIIEVIKSSVATSILSIYRELLKFNIRDMIKIGEKTRAANTKNNTTTVDSTAATPTKSE
ncbi:hypothetical protein CYY_002660 [Polysphondylium violaceum]|uniref:THUMP domain-containing protein n=1 Tax=Polysphondylium violaceum TaxID=133409 RepID=A0A8J4Q7N9_9MYCE|nr:hypothetical protein CYY_002660 [Polysphondylium violaceum]